LPERNLNSNSPETPRKKHQKAFAVLNFSSKLSLIIEKQFFLPQILYSVVFLEPAFITEILDISHKLRRHNRRFGGYTVSDWGFTF